MSLLEVVFKIRHDCPFGNLSRKFPSARMLVWCNREHEVVEVMLSNPLQYREMKKEIDGFADVVDVSSEPGNVHVITKKCHCTTRNSVGRNLDTHNMLHLMPVVYEAGWEYYHAIAFRHGDFKQFVRHIERLPCDLEIVRKSSIQPNLGGSVTISVSDLFSSLTNKQVDALLASYFMGYFRFPRKTNAMSIAKTKRIPRTTFQEHLTKAENKLVAGLVPYLRLLQAKPDRSSATIWHGNHLPTERGSALKVSSQYQRLLSRREP